MVCFARFLWANSDAFAFGSCHCGALIAAHVRVRMRTARLIALGVLSLFLTQCARFVPGIDVPGSATPTPAVDTPGVTPLSASALVDISEDDKTLGYPDQRKIAIDSQGRLYVAYRKQFRVLGALTYHIFVSRSDDGRTWTVLNNGEPVEQTGPYTQRVPAIVIAHDVIHLVWYGGDGNNTGSNQRQIKYVQSTDAGATWSPWVNLAEVPGYAEPQRLWQEHPCMSFGRGAIKSLRSVRKCALSARKIAV
jgi:hypothetical protein